MKIIWSKRSILSTWFQIYQSGQINLIRSSWSIQFGGWVGVEIEVNANSVPNWVGVGAGNELGKKKISRILH